MSKFYAVRHGLQTGIFDTWESCKASITGFSGAEYKSFKTIEEAEAYINGKNVASSAQSIPSPSEGHVQVLSRGITRKNLYGQKEIGVGVILHFSEKEINFYGLLYPDSADWVSSIGVDLLCCIIGYELALSLGFSNIDLYYSYEGCINWFDNTWLAHSEIAVKYKVLLNHLSSLNNSNLEFYYHNKKAERVYSEKLKALANRAFKFRDYINFSEVLTGALTADKMPSFKGL